MIRINLLPADLRRGSRLPARVIAASFAAALLVSAAVGWFGLVYFGDLAKAEQELASVQNQLDSRSGRVTYHDQLVANQKDYSLRVQTIQEIGNSRRVWTRFMDDLLDVVNNSGRTERHLAWFDGIQVKGDPKLGSTIKMPGNVQGDESDRVANFHEDLAAAAFATELKTKSDPTWQLELDESRIPAAYLRFPMELQFQPTVGKKK
ncbi:MAG: hypothetical protein KAI24_16505 [Planctomycetes bacterium]|nr:hypothetical protein [Planctomycetota bacterium]